MSETAETAVEEPPRNSPHDVPKRNERLANGSERFYFFKIFLLSSPLPANPRLPSPPLLFFSLPCSVLSSRPSTRPAIYCTADTHPLRKLRVISARRKSPSSYDRGATLPLFSSASKCERHCQQSLNGRAHRERRGTHARTRFLPLRKS